LPFGRFPAGEGASRPKRSRVPKGWALIARNADARGPNPGCQGTGSSFPERRSSGSRSQSAISPKIQSRPRAASWVKMTHICSCRSTHHFSGWRSSGPNKASVFAIASMREVYGRQAKGKKLGCRSATLRTACSKRHKRFAIRVDRPHSSMVKTRQSQ
jgi:hypothetical protein